METGETPLERVQRLLDELTATSIVAGPLEGAAHVRARGGDRRCR